jgi:hypothetical protein
LRSLEALPASSSTSATLKRGGLSNGADAVVFKTAFIPQERRRTSGQVLEDGGGVDGGGGTDAAVGGGAALQQTVDTTHGELEACGNRTNGKSEFN